MVMNASELAALLSADEPNYSLIAREGVPLLPHLRALMAGRSETLAARAASLAGYIDDDRAVGVLAAGAQNRSPTVRAAVAGALRQLARPSAVALLMRLLDDSHLSVRKFAIKASAQQSDPRLQTKLAAIGARDPSPALRQVAMAAIGGGRRGPGGNGTGIA